MLEGIGHGSAPSTRERARAWGRTFLLALVGAALLLCTPAVAGAIEEGPPPVDDLAPEVLGAPEIGERLQCYAGSWSGGVTRFTDEWLRSGIPVSSAVAYTTTTADEGSSLWCVVTAYTKTGAHAEAVSSNSVTMPGSKPNSPPRDQTPPQVSVSGQPAVGATLTCSTGTWTGNPEPKFSYQWLRDETTIAKATGSTYKAVSEDAGHSLSCEVTASNVSGKLAVHSSNSITIEGIKPVNERLPQVLGLQPSAVGESLTCSPGKWSETPAPTYSYRWVRDVGLPGEVLVEGATGSGYVIEPVDQLHSLSCIVIAKNSAGSAEAPSSNSIEVSGSPPENKTPPTVEGTPAVGETLICNPGAWSGVPTPTYEFAWLRDQQPIGSATSHEYKVKPEDKGQSLTCAVTARNVVAKNRERTASQLSAPVVVPEEEEGHERPANLEAPAVTPPGTATIGAMLTCSSGSWSGNPTPTLSYQWVRDPGPDKTLIGSATSGAYKVVQADAGHALACEVTALNGEGVASAISNEVEVRATKPEDVVKPKVEGTPAVGEPLTCVHGEWSGAPAPSFAYQWLREDVSIPSATAQTYVVASEDGGKAISCLVKATNIAGTGQATSSNSLVIPGHQPRNTVAPSVSGTPAVGETLSCSPGTWSGQPAPTYAYQWLLNGVAIPAATTSAYTVISTDPGLSLSCEVTASNREGSGSAVSASVHVPGLAPQDVEAPQVTGTPSVTQALTCAHGLWTGKPPPAFTYQWLRDGATITGATASTYIVELSDQGHTLSCVVTATNSEGTAEAASSNGMAIAGGSSGSVNKPLEQASPVDPSGPLPPPTSAQILNSLGAQLAHAQRRARVSLVRKTGQYSFSFTALAPGRLELYWYQLVKDPQHPSAAAKKLVLADCGTSFAGAGSRTVKLRLTSAGRRAFRHGKLVKLIVKGVFVQPGAHPLTWLETSVLSH
jgi:Immunoglobulin domain